MRRRRIWSRILRKVRNQEGAVINPGIRTHHIPSFPVLTLDSRPDCASRWLYANPITLCIYGTIHFKMSRRNFAQNISARISTEREPDNRHQYTWQYFWVRYRRTAAQQLGSSATAAAAGAHIASRSCVAHVWRLMCAVRIEITGQFHDYYMVCVQYVRCATVRLATAFRHNVRNASARWLRAARLHDDIHTHTRFVLYISFWHFQSSEWYTHICMKRMVPEVTGLFVRYTFHF